MVDVENLAKKWGYSSDFRECHLGCCLINQVCHDESKIVVLRIPTNKIHNALLRVRSQNRLFAERNNILWRAGKHEKFGNQGTKRNLYDAKKEAVEYIYMAQKSQLVISK